LKHFHFIEYWKQGWKIRLLFGLGGAALGYLYFVTIGCDGGCPITGDPWVSTAYGGFVGLLAYPGPSPAKKQTDNSSSHSTDGS